MRKIITGLFLVISIVILLILAGCVGNSDNQPSSDTSDNGDGRIIVPEADWTPAESEESSETASDDTDSEGEGEVAEETSETPDDGETVIAGPVEGGDDGGLESEISIDIYINGNLTEFGEPVRLFQGQRFDVRILLSSSIFEIVYYWVTTSDSRDEDYEGELSGYEAELNYTLFYNYSTWDAGGLSVVVRDALGNVTMKNLIFLPAEPLREPS